jgi:quercetin dioxygenase-like cupin family protein
MQVGRFDDAELQDSWIESDERARWRTMSGHAGQASGSALLEVPPGCQLPRHTDSAEETIVVVSGKAKVTIGEESEEIGAGEAALVPQDVPHHVDSLGDTSLRFVALYAAPEVVTSYGEEVQPDGERSRPAFER